MRRCHLQEHHVQINKDNQIVMYPSTRSKIRTWSFRAEGRVPEIPNTLNDRIPNFPAFCLVCTTAFNGSYATVHSVLQKIAWLVLDRTSNDVPQDPQDIWSKANPIWSDPHVGDIIVKDGKKKKKMEKIILNSVQLDFLARHDHVLCPHFAVPYHATNDLVIHKKIDVWDTSLIWIHSINLESIGWVFGRMGTLTKS